MEQPSRINELIGKMQSRQASADELAELMEWIRDDLSRERTLWLQAELGLPDSITATPTEEETVYWKAMAARILEADKEERALVDMPEEGRVQRLPVWRWIAAASVFIALAISAYFWLAETGDGGQKLVKQLTPEDIAPGKDGAILTLADGRQVVLDSLGNGVVAQQYGTDVVLEDGQLSYVDRTGSDDKLAYNTMTTPKGRQFQLQLPDGTKVWLNAASSIRYPTLFNGTTREVEIKGEAYFEVTKNKRQPFIVTINDQTRIEVLGTHFNINAYENEPAIKATLLEGAIRLNVRNRLQVLAPGQQAQVNATSAIKVVNDVNVNQVVAWKNGLFTLEDMSIREIMRQLERWYDIQVRYEGNIPEARFKGEIDKGVNLSEVLKFFADSDIPLKLEGRVLTVYGQ